MGPFHSLSRSLGESKTERMAYRWSGTAPKLELYMMDGSCNKAIPGMPVRIYYGVWFRFPMNGMKGMQLWEDKREEAELARQCLALLNLIAAMSENCENQSCRVEAVAETHVSNRDPDSPSSMKSHHNTKFEAKRCYKRTWTEREEEGKETCEHN